MAILFYAGIFASAFLVYMTHPNQTLLACRLQGRRWRLLAAMLFLGGVGWGFLVYAKETAILAGVVASMAAYSVLPFLALLRTGRSVR